MNGLEQDWFRYDGFIAEDRLLDRVHSDTLKVGMGGTSEHFRDLRKPHGLRNWHLLKQSREKRFSLIGMGPIEKQDLIESSPKCRIQ